jgi:N-acetylmuramoyl-L-alanine amidase CwlA
MEIKENLISVNNFGTGRKGWSPDRIVIHVEEGTEQATDSWFSNDSSDVSAHYGIDKKGNIEQFVLERDTAWANGRVDHPTAKIVLARPNVNPNYYTISIEHEGTGLEDLTDEQRKSSAWLVADIARRYDILLDRDHVLRHHEIYSLKTCPGAIDVDKILELAKMPIPENSVIPKIVWSDYFKEYLIVTKYNSDSDWYFLPLSKVGFTGSLKAQTPLSQFKRTV